MLPSMTGGKVMLHAVQFSPAAAEFLHSLDCMGAHGGHETGLNERVL